MTLFRHFSRAAGVAAACTVLLGAQASDTRAQSAPQQGQPPVVPVPSLPDQPLLVPTVHTALPLNVDDYWFAPSEGERSSEQDHLMASASGAFAAGNFTSAMSYAEKAARI